MAQSASSADLVFTGLVLAAAIGFAFAFEMSENLTIRADATLSMAKMVPCCRGEAPRSGKVLRFAVAPLLTPGTSFPGLSAFSQYLSGRLGQPVEVVKCRTFAEIEAQIRLGEVGIALVGSGPYVVGRKKFGLVPVGVPIVGGASRGRSYLVVPAHSPDRTWSDLRGKSFAFADSLSSSGRLVPTFAISELGAEADGFFRKVVYTHGFVHSLQAVANGLVDGASVDGLMFDAAIKSDPNLKRKVRVAWQSAEFGNGPVVMHRRTPRPLREQVSAVLIGMRDGRAGCKVLEQMGLDGFLPPDPGAYRSLEAMVARTGAKL